MNTATKRLPAATRLTPPSPRKVPGNDEADQLTFQRFQANLRKLEGMGPRLAELRRFAMEVLPEEERASLPVEDDEDD